MKFVIIGWGVEERETRRIGGIPKPVPASTSATMHGMAWQKETKKQKEGGGHPRRVVPMPPDDVAPAYESSSFVAFNAMAKPINGLSELVCNTPGFSQPCVMCIHKIRYRAYRGVH